MDYDVTKIANQCLWRKQHFHGMILAFRQALFRMFPADENTHTITNKHVGVETTESVIQDWTKHLIATMEA